MDSKFCLSIKSGAAEDGVKDILSRKNLNFRGFHCHIGSQIFELKPFRVAVGILVEFIKEMKEKHGFQARDLNLGGGFGIWYAEGDRKAKASDYKDFVKVICDALRENCDSLGVKRPRLVLEPGKAIVRRGRDENKPHITGPSANHKET